MLEHTKRHVSSEKLYPFEFACFSSRQFHKAHRKSVEVFRLCSTISALFSYILSNGNRYLARRNVIFKAERK